MMDDHTRRTLEFNIERQGNGTSALIHPSYVDIVEQTGFQTVIQPLS
jgi:hypothetical protein